MLQLNGFSFGSTLEILGNATVSLLWEMGVGRSLYLRVPPSLYFSDDRRILLVVMAVVISSGVVVNIVVSSISSIIGRIIVPRRNSAV
jgi:hypothetical protein